MDGASIDPEAFFYFWRGADVIFDGGQLERKLL